MKSKIWTCEGAEMDDGSTMCECNPCKLISDVLIKNPDACPFNYDFHNWKIKRKKNKN